MLDKQIDFFGFIVCFENPALRSKTKPPVSRVVVYFPDGRGREIRVR